MCKQGATFLLVEKSILLCNTRNPRQFDVYQQREILFYFLMRAERQISQCRFLGDAEARKEPVCEDERCLSTWKFRKIVSRSVFFSYRCLRNEIVASSSRANKSTIFIIMENNRFGKKYVIYVASYDISFYQNEKTVSRPVPDFSGLIRHSRFILHIQYSYPSCNMVSNNMSTQATLQTTQVVAPASTKLLMRMCEYRVCFVLRLVIATNKCNNLDTQKRSDGE
jgi:hypothetical protein